MHADYFLRWMGSLAALLEPGERVLARGRAFEPLRDISLGLTQVVSGPGCALLVTERRVLWLGRGDERWVSAVPFDAVTSYAEITQGASLRSRVDHREVRQLQWLPGHHLLWWSWGNAEAIQGCRRSVLAFSRRETKAAAAIRSLLQALGIPAKDRVRLPGDRRRGRVPYRLLKR